jgi:hypothetical protein
MADSGEGRVAGSLTNWKVEAEGNTKGSWTVIIECLCPAKYADMLPPVLRSDAAQEEHLRLLVAFQQFMVWRWKTAKKHDKTPSPLKVGQADAARRTALFARRPDSEHSQLSGQSRNLAAQRAYVYGGHCGGQDSIGTWNVLPLGVLCEAYLQVPATAARSRVWVQDSLLAAVEVRFVEEEKFARELPVPSAAEAESAEERVTLLRERVQLELHKVEAFISWFESRRHRNPLLWRPFPTNMTLSSVRVSGQQLKMARKIFSNRGRLHRGFLLYGPAGTGLF